MRAMTHKATAIVGGGKMGEIDPWLRRYESALQQVPAMMVCLHARRVR